ncbi:MAG TPA: glycerophosphodiester phosphodiesterase family protein [Steroidobacteraceae bacterium]|nr:glycerophosphodiester phosphodiesterase family protein [Steroidobacteraceae bacterium]
MSQTGPIHLVAHRGDARDYPENTIPAFASALSNGVHHLELDVHLSSDGVPMVIHDHQLLRTTGRKGCVFELNAAQLLQLSAHEPQRFGERYQGTRIPLLSDVLALLQGRPEVTLFVEIKRASLAHFGHEQVVSRITEVLRPGREQCVIISFDLAAIYRARQLGGFAVGWVLPEYDPHARLKYEAVQPEFLFCDQEKLPARGALWRGPWRWVIYEIDDWEQALALATRGVHYIETMAVQPMCQAMRIWRAGPTASARPS